jgi:hypothetical protein
LAANVLLIKPSIYLYLLIVIHVVLEEIDWVKEEVDIPFRFRGELRSASAEFCSHSLICCVQSIAWSVDSTPNGNAQTFVDDLNGLLKDVSYKAKYYFWKILISHGCKINHRH